MMGASPLLTDLYQLSMIQGYLDYGMNDIAVFELFVRRLPRTRNFLVAAGLEQLLEFLQDCCFSADEIKWLAKTGRFKPTLLDYLASFRFTGDVNAMPEGTVFFENEPLVQIIAPLPQAQLIETRLINIIHFQTLIASKAARISAVAPGKILVDFGVRRAHGAEAGLAAARASYLAGFSGTSTVEAARVYDIPVSGTMAHSFIESHDDELIAFEHFAVSNPTSVTLLLDTYDTEVAAREVVELAQRLREKGVSINGVRLDSGNLYEHAWSVRRILDAGGLGEVRIFVSGGLDEKIIQNLLSRGAPIDGFGVGTSLTTSSDAPFLDCAYKIVEYAGTARRKTSEGKATLPGRKQVFRYKNSCERPMHDTVALSTELAAGEALLLPVMRKGRRVGPRVSLSDARARCLADLECLPTTLKSLEASAVPYPVEVSDGLERLIHTRLSA